MRQFVGNYNSNRHTTLRMIQNAFAAAARVDDIEELPAKNAHFVLNQRFYVCPEPVLVK
jgi:hypothetical protein